MKLEQIINLKLNNFEIKVPKKEVNLADYPWEKCIADQTERYGDEETAAKVCGAIKAMYGSKEEMEIEPNPCYEGYQPIGMKEKDGKMVPNCVPIKEEQSKQEFVIPTPDGGETEQDYIGRCIGAIGKEYDVEGQAYAVCKGTWDEK